MSSLRQRFAASGIFPVPTAVLADGRPVTSDIHGQTLVSAACRVPRTSPGVGSIPGLPAIDGPAVLKGALAAAGLLLFFYSALVPLAAHVESIGSMLAEHVGLWGVGLYVFVVDTLILPASTDLLMPFVLQWPAGSLLIVISGASILAGIAGYGVGRTLIRIPVISRRMQSWEQRHIRLIERHGMWAVAAAAALPLPFSTISWLAGALHVRLSRYILGALFRIPRMVVTFYLLREGMLLLG
ncbi:YqaA family protein [Spirochaeta africana]|uniref:Putative membrane protein n=1 Tax=Spirochaeta africana (strain ATCC 700263 / DSM 8902 / Z-7692) TaxID=889378 RepID=H9UH28_SPIAZ|nr:VTT domain-containing protein [Spirochaeta africana]AFG36821.1 putative membrane protein [Spirochaeta africana DSM 8902]